MSNVTMSKSLTDAGVAVASRPSANPLDLHPLATVSVTDSVSVTVTGYFGLDPFRPYFLAETSLISWTFRPQNIDVSDTKYGRFGQNIIIGS